MSYDKKNLTFGSCIAELIKLVANKNLPDTFVDIDHEIISTVILLPSAESSMKGCCQLQAKVCARNTGETTSSGLPRKKCG